VGSIGQREIFKVVKPIYLFYDQKEKKLLSEKEAATMLNISAIFEQGMYFSFSYDLASRLTPEPEGDNYLFNWAQHIQTDLGQMDRMWRVSIIQGFVGKLELHINGVKLCIALISRRSVKRGGTQSYARGIDAQGNAGNYVETEQIITMQDHYFSFLQVRGSAPFMWSGIKSSYGFSSAKCEGSA
jgi:phosphatidylinositol 4-phosphatase